MIRLFDVVSFVVLSTLFLTYDRPYFVVVFWVILLTFLWMLRTRKVMKMARQNVAEIAGNKNGLWFGTVSLFLGVFILHLITYSAVYFLGQLMKGI